MERRDRESRFFARVGPRLPSGCDPWQGQVSGRSGGGIFYDDDNRQRSAQRVRWELAHGDLPARTSVTHTCALPTCVRLDHLAIGRSRPGARVAAALVEVPAARGAGPAPDGDLGRAGDGALDAARRARDEASRLRARAHAAVLRSAELAPTEGRPPDQR